MQKNNYLECFFFFPDRKPVDLPIAKQYMVAGLSGDEPSDEKFSKYDSHIIKNYLNLS